VVRNSFSVKRKRLLPPVTRGCEQPGGFHAVDLCTQREDDAVGGK
jgi:hypothetical protein